MADSGRTSASESQSIGAEVVPIELRAAVIAECGRDIARAMDHVMSLRTRTAFTIWIGPYILLGSVVVGTRSMLRVDLRDATAWVAFGVAVACYLFLGALAGIIERYTLERANLVCKCIITVASAGTVSRNSYLDEELPRRIVKTYVLIFSVLLLCFLAVAVLVSRIQVAAAG